MKVRVETIHQYCSEKQRIAKKCLTLKKILEMSNNTLSAESPSGLNKPVTITKIEKMEKKFFHFCADCEASDFYWFLNNV